MNEQQYSIRAASELSGFDPITFRRAITKGEIDHKRCGKKIFIPAESLKAFILVRCFPHALALTRVLGKGAEV